MVVKDTVKPAPPPIEQVQDDRPIWEIILESGPKIPAEERAAAPHDGAQNYKHYLYGHPKKEQAGQVARLSYLTTIMLK